MSLGMVTTYTTLAGRVYPHGRASTSIFKESVGPGMAAGHTYLTKAPFSYYSRLENVVSSLSAFIEFNDCNAAKSS